MATICAIGLMSGTSMDGIDLAMLRTDGVNLVEQGPCLSVPYEAAFRERIIAGLEVAKQITQRSARPGDLAALEQDITRRHAAAVEKFLSDQAGCWTKPELIGFHGQTVLHRPQQALTVQLGDGQMLADLTGLPVVFDMRAEDMRHGGQGAPLVPAYHAALARSLPENIAGRFPVVFVNIGGISNITYVPKNGDPIAFDTGPGNGLIDQWVMQKVGISFDQDGEIARQGQVDEDVVASYLQSPFFDRPGPKSLDRGDFTLAQAEGLKLADGARTLAALSARAILKATTHLPERPVLWIICGGGRKNPHIMHDLKAGAQKMGAQVISAEEAGLDGDATEAEAWAYLAVRSYKKMPLTFPSTTGCDRPVSGGIFVKKPLS
ncbi:anhydro-N-acetylmuramic acid kinase [Aquamicrobium segne]|uniref:Anhydro-N-acetylmuramic acid kinase n=1 Tax=Aquamicrobium segne TaxID=469547 RepID=A0ABW0GY06_9HYPH